MLEVCRGSAGENEEVGRNQSVQSTRNREFADKFEFFKFFVPNSFAVDTS